MWGVAEGILAGAAALAVAESVWDRVGTESEKRKEPTTTTVLDEVAARVETRTLEPPSSGMGRAATYSTCDVPALRCFTVALLEGPNGSICRLRSYPLDSQFPQVVAIYNAADKNH